MLKRTPAEPYAAVLIHRSSSTAPGYEPLYDETVVLLTAGSEAEATEKAERWGRRREHSYVNVDGERVTWTLETVVDVARVYDQASDDGREIYSRFFRDYASYRSFEPLLDGDPL